MVVDKEGESILQFDVLNDIETIKDNLNVFQVIRFVLLQMRVNMIAELANNQDTLLLQRLFEIRNDRMHLFVKLVLSGSVKLDYLEDGICCVG